MERVMLDGELQTAKVYFNGELVKHRDLLEEVEGDFVKDFKNNLFTARLSIEKGFNYPVVYYEKRRVNNIYIPSVVGVVEIGKDTLTLQEPDRKNIIYDDKRHKFEDKLLECRKELYKDFIKLPRKKG